MFKRFVVICFCALSLGSLTLVAQSSDSNQKSGEPLPRIITSGLQAYKEKGPEEAIKAWLKGSPLEGSKEALGEANNLRTIEGYYGPFQGAELINTKSFAARTKVFRVVLDFDKGPVFGKFIVYRSGENWIVTAFDFNTKPDSILP